jgi:hypothetical protein
MKELSAIEKLEFVKTTMETLGFNFGGMTVEEAFEMFKAIKFSISHTLAMQM